MKKRIFYLFFCLIAFLNTFYIYHKNDKYIFKAEFEIKNLNAEFIDKNIAFALQKELLQHATIKDVVTFSKENKMELYCKINPFSFNKKNILREIENKIIFFSKNYYEITKIKIDNKYSQDYSCMIVVYNFDYFKLKNYSKEILKEMLNLNSHQNILMLGDFKIANYVYFSASDLLNFDINISDLKKLIIDNNQKENQFITYKKTSKYYNSINGKITTIEDLKNILVPYKDKNYSIKFQDAFKIKKEINKQESPIIYFDDKYAIAFMVSKKSFYPQFLFNFKLCKLKKYNNIKIIKTSKLEKIEITFDENINIDTLEDFYNNLKNKFKGDILYFINEKINEDNIYNDLKSNQIIIYSNKASCDKIKKYLQENNILYFDENSKYKIIYCSHLGNLEKKLLNYKNFELLATRKTMAFDYEILNNKLNKYFIEKKEILNTIFANNDGLMADSYNYFDDIIEIILKNDDPHGFIYSKKFKKLTDIEDMVKITLKSQYKVIARKNLKYFSLIKFKPF